jgi:hypothetical protein
MRRLVVMGMVLCLGGCKDKVAESLLLLRHRVDEVQRKLDLRAKQSSTELAPQQADARPFDPPLRCASALSGNAIIVSFTSLAGQKRAIELGFDNPVRELASRLERSNDATNLADLRAHTSKLPGEVAAAEAIRYLVLYRFAKLELPSADAPGTADVEIFVHDLGDQGNPRRYQRILTLTPAGGSGQELLGTAHDEVIDAIVKSTGGRVDVERRIAHANFEAGKFLMEHAPSPPLGKGGKGDTLHPTK